MTSIASKIRHDMNSLTREFKGVKDVVSSDTTTKEKKEYFLTEFEEQLRLFVERTEKRLKSLEKINC